MSKKGIFILGRHCEADRNGDLYEPKIPALIGYYLASFDKWSFFSSPRIRCINTMKLLLLNYSNKRGKTGVLGITHDIIIENYMKKYCSHDIKVEQGDLLFFEVTGCLGKPNYLKTITGAESHRLLNKFEKQFGKELDFDKFCKHLELLNETGELKTFFEENKL